MLQSPKGKLKAKKNTVASVSFLKTALSPPPSGLMPSQGPTFALPFSLNKLLHLYPSIAPCQQSEIAF